MHKFKIFILLIYGSYYFNRILIVFNVKMFDSFMLNLMCLNGIIPPNLKIDWVIRFLSFFTKKINNTKTRIDKFTIFDNL